MTFLRFWRTSGPELLHCPVVDVELPGEVSNPKHLFFRNSSRTYCPPLLSSLPVRLLHQEFTLTPRSDLCGSEIGLGQWPGPGWMREQAMMRRERMP